MDPTTTPPPLPLKAYDNGHLTLYHLESSMSIRALWALEELSVSAGLNYSMKSFPRVRVRGGGTPGIFKASPIGLAPALEIQPVSESTLTNAAANATSGDETGDNGGKAANSIILSESRLILQHLSAKYANDLWTPKTEAEQLRDIYFTEFASTITHRVDFVLLFDMIPTGLPWLLRLLIGRLFYYIAEIMGETLPRMFKMMDGALTDEFPWFSGTNIGVADFMMSFPIDMAVQRGYLKMEEYPGIKRWIDERDERKAWGAAMAKVGKYNLKTFQ